MGQQKGGKKLRRTQKHKGMYLQQKMRTKRHKIKAYKKALELTTSEDHKTKLLGLINKPA